MLTAGPVGPVLPVGPVEPVEPVAVKFAWVYAYIWNIAKPPLAPVDDVVRMRYKEYALYVGSFTVTVNTAGGFPMPANCPVE